MIASDGFHNGIIVVLVVEAEEHSVRAAYVAPDTGVVVVVDRPGAVAEIEEDHEPVVSKYLDVKHDYPHRDDSSSGAYLGCDGWLARYLDTGLSRP